MIIGHEGLQTDTHLVQISDASDLIRLCLGSGERRQQQRCEDCNNGDDDQQFHQGERLRFQKERVLICHWRFTKDAHDAMTPNEKS